MVRFDVTFVQDQRIEDIDNIRRALIHAKKIYETIPLRCFLELTIIVREDTLLKILCKTRLLNNEITSPKGYVGMDILAVETLTDHFEGAAHKNYHMFPEKIVKWKKVSRRDLPLYLGWPVQYHGLAEYIKNL